MACFPFTAHSGLHGITVSLMVEVINGSDVRSRAADALQAEYYRRELSGIRAQAETDLARHHIELQQCLNSGQLTRAADVRRFIRALEYELITLERLGEGLNRWL